MHFFFNDPATTEIYTLSLHDALPILWTPDVYEGAPTPITAFFAVAPKVAALALLARVLMSPFGELLAQWQQILVVLAMASMVLGAFAAIGQRNIKRLMAYSSIGHVGFARVGLSSGTPEGARGLLVYLTIDRKSVG